MQHFRFCVALRHPDGSLDVPVREKSIIAGNAAGAIEAAKRIHVDMIGSGTNSLYLTAPNGHAI